MTSHPEFNEKTTATEVASVFTDQIRDKVVVITGVGPNSLGETLAVTIGSHQPAKLILASRTRAKLEQVARKVQDATNKTSVEIVPMNLSSQKSIRHAASMVQGLVDRVDVLINNAGVMVPDHHFTEEGIELQFGTNHIGHFLFTTLLMPQLKVAAGNNTSGATRIINVTSAGHRLSPIRFHDYNFQGNPIPPEECPPTGLPAMFTVEAGRYNGWLAYGQSKTANILFSRYLTDRLRSSGILSYAVHPGSIYTNLSRHLDEEARATVSKTGSFWKSLDQGAATMLVAAFDPMLNEPPSASAAYLSNCQFDETAPHATSIVSAERLADLSQKLVGISLHL